MNILITCVCYNNFRDAFTYIESLSKALSISKSVIKVDLYLVNNGVPFEAEQREEIVTVELLDVILVENKTNDGYFPGCLKGYKQSLSTQKKYDVMLVSNVDLEVSEDFFNQLILINDKYQKTPTIIAPSILSLSENKDRNPKVKTRFTKKQMQKYLLLYAIPYLHLIYKKTAYKLNKSIKNIENGSTIYAPHGSFIVFVGGSEFWQDFLNYPVFLFGEEIYIGEQSNVNNILVRYHTELKVIDSDHASTGKENEHFIRKHNFQAIRYHYNRYWKV